MKRELTIFLFLFCFLLTGQLLSQEQSQKDQRSRVRTYSSPQEIVNMDSTTRMDQALQALGEMSKKFAGKSIVDLEKRTNNIGVEIVNQQWRDALETILEHNALWYREDPQYLIIMTADMVEALEGTKTIKEKKPTLDSREVLVTTSFVSLDLSKASNMGVNWSFSNVKGNDTVGGSSILGLDKSAFDFNYGRAFKGGSLSALLQFYQSDGIADIIASPRLSITSGDSGMAQVGEDISVLTRDIGQGGTISLSVKPVQTGTIVRIKPEIIREDTISFIWVELNIERSFAVTTGDLPVINRNQTHTRLLLIDGEEAFISGLYYNETDITRAGIPFLKDLPPWVLGLRYIFGSDAVTTDKKELAIIIRAEILPSLRERAAQRGKAQPMVLDKIRKGFDDDIERIMPKRDKDK